jgi:hypothetical protein
MTGKQDRTVVVVGAGLVGGVHFLILGTHARRPTADLRPRP